MRKQRIAHVSQGDIDIPLIEKELADIDYDLDVHVCASDV